MKDILNVEIKAKSPDSSLLHDKLTALGADYKGCDHQIDTYFNCPEGRLKLRKGNIENSLIFYNRINQSGPKESDIALERLGPDNQVDHVLEKAYGIKVKVDKKRHIYFIDNVKFHIDEVVELGDFMEIEAIDTSGVIGLKKLTEQCNHYIDVLNIKKENLVESSYSDLIMRLNS